MNKDPIPNRSLPIVPVVDQVINIEDRFFFLGTMHISQSSADSVKDAISKNKPDCVMVELDNMRYKRIKEQENISDKGEETNSQPKQTLNEIEPNKEESSLPADEPVSFFSNLQRMQEYVGDLMGMTPGLEMITALEIVEELKIPMRLIDLPIIETIKKLNKLEQEQGSSLEGLVVNPETDHISKEEIEGMMKDIGKEGFLSALLKEFAKEYPALYKILIKDRDQYMSERILHYHQKNPEARILVILGAGHLQGIIQRIKERE